MQPTLATTYDRIAPKIRSCAYIVSQQCSIDQDDLEQIAWLKLTERVVVDPAYLERPDAQIVTYAAWRMKHIRDQAHTYDSHVDEEYLYLDDEGDENSSFEWITDPSIESNPEELEIRRELEEGVRKALTGLSASNRKIASMLAGGFSVSEIAAILDISLAAVCQRKRAIAGCLRLAGIN